MVHFRSPFGVKFERDYWKLGDRNEDAQSRAWNSLIFSDLHKPQRLAYLSSRTERGLIDYDQLDIEQLKTFCSQRGISLPSPSPGQTGDLRDLLEDEDERGATFTGFLRLPAEIRVQIYGIHTAWLQERLLSLKRRYTPELASDHCILVTPPPLASVCQAIRAEFLPVFCRSFRWHVYLYTKPFRSIFGSYPPFVMSFSVKQVSSSYLRYLQSVCLVMGYEEREGEFRRKKTMTWAVDLPSETRPLKVVPQRWNSGAHRRFRQKFDKVLKNMAERPGDMHFNHDDIKSILEAYK